MIFRKLMMLGLLVMMALPGRVQAQPTITGLFTPGESPTNNATLTWLLSFSESVSGVTPANFTLDGSGVTGNIAGATPLPGNINWLITVDTVAGDGTLGLNLTNPAGISGVSGPLTETYTGETYIVDRISPEVVSITRIDPSPTIATTVRFEITFSEQIYNLSVANFAPGGAGTSGNVVSVSPTANPLVWTGTVSNITGAGLLSLDLNDTSQVTDEAGNWLLSDFTSGEQYQIAPQVLCISRLDASPTSATSVSYRVQFNAPVLGFTDANVVANGPGGVLTDVVVAPESGTEPETDWIVTVGPIAGSGTVEISLQNPASIAEANGIALLNLNPTDCNETVYEIDQTPPAPGCITPLSPPDNSVATSSTVVAFQIVFNEPVTGVSISNFDIQASDLLSYSPAVSTEDGGITWVIEVTGIAEDVSNATPGRIAVAWSNADGILDASGNAPILPAQCPPAYYDIDQRQPALVCITQDLADAADPTSASTVRFRLEFDEPVAVDSLTSTDLQVALEPASGFLEAVIEDVQPVTAGAASAEFVVTVSEILGNNAVTPPFEYGADSIGNGYLSVEVAPNAEITDVAGNLLVMPVELSDQCDNTSFTIDQVPPRVLSAELDVTDCMTRAIFTVGFSENVTSLTESNLQVNWSGGSCDNPQTTTTITRVSNTTFTVEVHGYYETFHQNGPGLLSLEIIDPHEVIRDVAGNPLAASFSSEPYDICRCFEPAVGIAPRALTEVRYYDTDQDTVCPGTDICTPAGLESAYGDLHTTVSQPEFLQWMATEWDCRTTEPFNVYIDEQFTTRTSGGIDTSMVSQWLPNTPNDLCYPGGTRFTLPLNMTFTPGLHSYRINIDGDCTSGTLMYFNVLDAPEILWPNGLTVCTAPHAFSWTEVEGAFGYEIFYRRAGIRGDRCFTKLGSVTSDTLYLNDPEYPTSPGPGEYEWFVRAYNEHGHQDSVTASFEIVTPNPITALNLMTDGTVYDVEVRGNITFIAGDFTLVRDASGVYHSRPYLAAFNNLTEELLPALNAQPNNAVYTMEFSGNDLYIGGTFTYVDDTQLGRIARLTLDTNSNPAWDYRLDPDFAPGANDVVRAIEVIGNNVYYAGEFTRVGVQVYNFGNFDQQVPAVRLAIADAITTTNKPTSAGIEANATVYDLLSTGDQLYIAGAFSEIGNQNIRGLARANLTTTAAIDTTFDLDIQSDVSHYVYKLELADDRLYFGGSFTSVHGEPRQNAASIEVSRTTTTTTLLPWDPQPHGGVYDIKRDSNTGIIFLGGTFTAARQQHHGYLLGVDPLIGRNITCDLDQLRPVYGIDSIVVPSADPNNPDRTDIRLQVGGLSTAAP